MYLRVVKSLVLTLAIILAVFGMTPKQLNFSDVAAHWLTECATSNAHTARGRAQAIRAFLAYLSKNEIDDIGKVTPAFINEFEAEMSAKYARSTVAVTHDHLKALFQFAADKGVIKENPFKRVRKPMPEKAQPKWLTEDELKKVSYVLSVTESAKNYQLSRAGVSIALMLYAGLRPVELIKLNRNQLNETTRTIESFVRKGGRVQTLPYPSALDAQIENYLAARSLYVLRQGIDLNNQDRVSDALPLLLTNRGDYRIDSKTLFNSVRALLGKNINQYRLRHTAIRAFLDRTNDLVLTAQFGGHDKIETTMRYAMRSFDEIRKGIEV